MKTNPACLIPALLLVALAGAATEVRAQILHFQRTIYPGTNTRAIADAGDGTLLLTDSGAMFRYSESWSLLLSRVASQWPGDDQISSHHGALRMSDGRLLTLDLGGAFPRLILMNDSGRVLSAWPVPRGTHGWSTPKLGSADRIFIATNNSGVTTIRRWDTTGALTASWSLTTAACVLAVRNGVVYLAGDVNGLVFKFNEDGVPLGSIPTVINSSVRGIDVDNSGRIFAISWGVYVNGVLSVHAPGGTRLEALAYMGTANFTQPLDLVLFNNSTIYVADVRYEGGAVHQVSIQDAVPATAVSWGRMKALYR